MTFAIFGLGPVELGFVALIALLLFGRKLPEVARSMGRGVVEFKRGLKDIEEDVDTPQENRQQMPPPPPPPPAPPSE